MLWHTQWIAHKLRLFCSLIILIRVTRSEVEWCHQIHSGIFIIQLVYTQIFLENKRKTAEINRGLVNIYDVYLFLNIHGFKNSNLLMLYVFHVTIFTLIEIPCLKNALRPHITWKSHALESANLMVYFHGSTLTAPQKRRYSKINDS